MWMGTAFGQLLAKVPFARTGVGGQTTSPLGDRNAGFGHGYLNGSCPSALFGSTAVPALRVVSNSRISTKVVCLDKLFVAMNQEGILESE